MAKSLYSKNYAARFKTYGRITGAVPEPLLQLIPTEYTEQEWLTEATLVLLAVNKVTLKSVHRSISQMNARGSERQGLKLMASVLFKVFNNSYDAFKKLPKEERELSYEDTVSSSVSSNKSEK